MLKYTSVYSMCIIRLFRSYFKIQPSIEAYTMVGPYTPKGQHNSLSWPTKRTMHTWIVCICWELLMVGTGFPTHFNLSEMLISGYAVRMLSVTRCQWETLYRPTVVCHPASSGSRSLQQPSISKLHPWRSPSRLPPFNYISSTLQQVSDIHVSVVI